MKKVNFKQPKYILPLVIFLPLAFLGYTITNFFGEEDDSKKGVVTDNINMTLPDAKNGEMTDKMTEMTKRFSEDGAYTAIGALGNEKEELDSTQAGYKEHELNSIDAENAKREAKQKELEDLERSLAESRKHINAYAYEGNSSGGGRGGRGGYGGRGSSRQDELDDYARDLEYIQQRSKERQKVLEQAFGGGSSAGVWLQVMAQEVAVTVLAVALVTGKPLRSRSLNWCRRCLSRMPTSSIPSVSRLRSMSR